MRRNRIQKECLYCGKPLETTPSTGRKYCSQECAHNAKRTATQMECPTCGCQFWVAPFFLKRTRHHFCSRKCYDAAKRRPPRKYIKCKVCGQEFGVAPNNWRYYRSDICSNECGYEFAVRGRRQEQIVSCASCGKQLKRKPFAMKRNRRHYCSVKCMGHGLAIHNTGPNNGRWKGGFEPYYGPNWRAQRRAALRRDNFTCQACGKSTLELGQHPDVHHIIRFNEFGIEQYEKANELDNLVSLCINCHRQAEHYEIAATWIVPMAETVGSTPYCTPAKLYDVQYPLIEIPRGKVTKIGLTESRTA